MSNQVAKVERDQVPAVADVSPMFAMIERFRQLLNYDAPSGEITWKTYRGRLAKKGQVAGTIVQDRRYIKVDGKFHLAHRIAYAMVTGEFPKHEIDHINGDPSDNRWMNLRACTHSENMQNKAASNPTGLLGVSKHRCGKWQSNIRVNHKQIYLGLFDSPQLAHAAYIQAKQKFHTFNPGVRRP